MRCMEYLADSDSEQLRLDVLVALEKMSPEQRNFFTRSSCWRRNISRASRVVAVSFYQLIPLGGVLTSRPIPFYFLTK